MDFFKRLIDLLTLRSERPIRRLAAYYALLGVVATGFAYGFPAVDRMFSGPPEEQVESPQLLQDGLTESAEPHPPQTGWSARLELGLNTVLICAATLALMLPVAWVYMSARSVRNHSQSVVQALIILPIIVAGIILVVRSSLALAFSLAGVVSVLRFRTTLSDIRDIIYIFLGIAVGFAAGVQLLTVAVVLSVIFNFVLLFTWRYDFGRNVLEPTAGSEWAEPLDELARRGTAGHGATVPDRDLVLALTPTKVGILAERFKRVQSVLGPDAKEPRYNGILAVTANEITAAQAVVEMALGKVAKRWRLDEVVTNAAKPSELYYLVKTRKSLTENDVLTAIRTGAGPVIATATLEIGDAIEREAAQKKAAEKGSGVP